MTRPRILTANRLVLYDRFTVHVASRPSGNPAVRRSGNWQISQGYFWHVWRWFDDPRRKCAVHAVGKNRVHPFIVPTEQCRCQPCVDGMKLQAVISVSNCLRVVQSCHGTSFQYGALVLPSHGRSDQRRCCALADQGLGRLRVMSKDACRPFSATRKRRAWFSEGAGPCVEEYEHASAARQRLVRSRRFCHDPDASDCYALKKQGAARTDCRG
jgi:hypothetical protein